MSDCSLFVGVDLGTGGVRCVALAPPSTIVAEGAVSFDDDFPARDGHAGGVVREGAGARSPVSLWVDGVALALRRLCEALGPERSQAIAGVAVSGQQHSFVFAAERSVDVDGGSWRSVVPLGAWATSWMDGTAVHEARALEAALAQRGLTVARVTGTAAQPRYTAAQLMRALRETVAATAPPSPPAGAGTAHGIRAAICDGSARVCLASSFATSLLIDAIAPMDFGDASGMNLLDTRGDAPGMFHGGEGWQGAAAMAPPPPLHWHNALLAAVAAGAPPMGPDAVRALLGAPCPPMRVVGAVGALCAHRTGLPRGAPVVCGTGDNLSAATGADPASLIISLGTSATLFRIVGGSGGGSGIKNQRMSGSNPEKSRSSSSGSSSSSSRSARLEFVDAVDPRRRVVLVCASNGSGPRDELCRRAFGGDWRLFDTAIEVSRREDPRWAGVGLFLPHPEAAMHGAAGVLRHDPESCVAALSTAGHHHQSASPGAERLLADGTGESFASAALEARAIVESQALLLQHLASQAGILDPPPSRIVVVGGGARSAALVAAIAEVFGTDAVETGRGADRAALGAALGAAHRAYICAGGPPDQLAARHRAVERQWSESLTPAPRLPRVNMPARELVAHWQHKRDVFTRLVASITNQ
jgi:sugar (pentulose or hexulose) kinase